MAKTGAERVRAHRQRQQDEVERLRRAHGDCIPVADLAEDLRTNSLLSKEAIRSHVRMYLKIATKKMRPGADDAHETLLTVRREIRAIEDERRNVWRQECDDALAEAADLSNELFAARARIGTLERSATNREKRRAAKLEAEIREGSRPRRPHSDVSGL